MLCQLIIEIMFNTKTTTVTIIAILRRFVPFFSSYFLYFRLQIILPIPKSGVIIVNTIKSHAHFLKLYHCSP